MILQSNFAKIFMHLQPNFFLISQLLALLINFFLIQFNACMTFQDVWVHHRDLVYVKNT
mgnify:CR=1